MTMLLTERQQQLIRMLRNNSRASIHALATEQRQPTSSMTDLLHKLERKDIIKHVTHVAFDKVGWPVRLLIALKVDTRNRKEIEQTLSTCKNLNTLHVINSGYDYLAEMIFRNQKDASDFLDNLDEKHTIISKTAYTIIDTIHQERFLANESHYE